ncbi:MAG: AIR synthase family protein [Caldiserica bacterium]|jgi:hydrogenase maturation factor|nr:AIR synthase family protein [Caldisericota bacterium]MDH7561834.1 AIR synthase family protein [Caldisericota bacterium]
MPRLQAGKLSNFDLERLIFPHLGCFREDVKLHASFGEDTSIIDLGDELCVLSTDPITGTSKEIGWLAVHISVNDIAASGAEPLGILLTVLLPSGFPSEEIENLMKEASSAAESLGIEILGGHTEYTPYLPQPIIVGTAVGKVPRGRYLSTKGAQPGDSLFVSKALALEGTAILAREFREELIPLLGNEVVEKGSSFIREISVVKEGVLARRFGARALHDITEGGVIGGAWEMAQASGLGVALDFSSFPLREETLLICRALEADPLFLLSSGSMLIASPPDLDLAEVFSQNGIKLTKIGEFIPQEGVFIKREGKMERLSFEVHEELWRVLERRKK